MRRSFFFIATVSLFSACADSTDAPTDFPHAASAERHRNIIVMPSGGSPAELQGMDQVTFGKAHRDIYAVLGNGRLTLAEQDQSIRLVLEANAFHPASAVFKQVAGREMLKRLLAAPGSSEREQAIGYYTGALIEARSVEVALVGQALERLEGTWSAAQRRDAARGIHVNAQTYLRGRGRCLDASCQEVQAASAPMQERLDQVISELGTLESY